MARNREYRHISSIEQRYQYKTVALKEDTYDKVILWANHLRDKLGRCTIGEAVDYLADNAGVPPEEV